jgi:transposase-like protein
MSILLLSVHPSRSAVGHGIGPSEVEPFWSGLLKRLIKRGPKLRGRWPELAALLMGDSEHDVLAYMAYPTQHRTKSSSTNPIEPLNKEVMRAPGPSNRIIFRPARMSATTAEATRRLLHHLRGSRCRQPR